MSEAETKADATLEKVSESKLAEMRSYENTPIVGINNLQQIVNLAKVMSASGLFPNAETAQKAVGLMVLGQQFGMSAAQALTGIHVVKGKPMLHYMIVLAKVREHPNYDYKILEDSAKRACIEFFYKGESVGKSEFTAEDAVRAGTQNMDKWADVMLVARAASSGVKRYCPDVLGGQVFYVQGEIIPDEVAPGVDEAEAKVQSLRDEIAKRADALTIEGVDVPIADVTPPEDNTEAIRTEDGRLDL